ncbi:hypothetical protein JCM14036_08950 [Desulfotomaculum defluvii]
MQFDKTLTKPSIIICTVPFEGSETKLREIQAGIEEEGVPYLLQKSEQSDRVDLAYQGANASQLGVGIGISPTGICIHYHKLPEDQPLFSLDGDGTPEEWRYFGYNAARLVKGLPFKDMPTEDPALDLDTAQLYQLVREIVIKVEQELARGHQEVNA